MSAVDTGGHAERPRRRCEPLDPDLSLLRDDGRICVLLGRIAPGAVPPLLPALTGALIVGTLLLAGRGQLTGITLFAPVAALLLSGLASGHPHDGRFDWLVPPVLRVTEYGYLAVLGLASGVPGPLVSILLVVVACLHRDDVARPAAGTVRTDGVRAAGLGWEGRMLVIAVGGAFHALAPAYGILTGYLVVLLVHEAVRTWSSTPVTDVRSRTTAADDGVTDRTDAGKARTDRTGGARSATGTNGEA